MDTEDRFRGCLFGLAVGDAVGTTVEFKPRYSFPAVEDMVGGGPFRLKPGEWTDDMSMALCLAASLVETSGFDPVDQMQRYCRWRDEGYMSSNGRCFDIGGTVAGALSRFKISGDPYSGSISPHSAGNGCIMRLAPVPMFFWPDRSTAMAHAALSCKTTHGAPECLDASRLLAAVVVAALNGEDKEAVYGGQGDLAPDMAPKVAAIARGSYRSKAAAEIRGSGYVVDSLEAALWCFERTDSFREAVLMATNLGDDADTTAAVVGQVAGAYYGENGIPDEWRRRLALRDLIGGLADRLWNAASSRGAD